MPASPALGATQSAAHADWEALGTQVRLVVTDPGCLAEGRRLLEAELAAADAACSRFRADSELVAINATGTGGAGAAISPLLAGAITVALRAAWQTGGDVDPPVGAALAAVGHDRDFELVRKAGPPVRLTVQEVPGWRQVRLDAAAGRLSLPAGTQLDLGATAKAWAADRSATRLAARLSCGILVSLGGDIAVAGDPPPDGWRIRVQDASGRPEDPPAGPAAVVSIRGGGLATASTRARRWRRGGDVIQHILRPRAGLPAEPVWRTVSVAAASCVDASTASTAAIIKGRTAISWLTSQGLAARLVAADGAVHVVAGWPPDPPAPGQGDPA
jgi:thiamine biosynthesis lipoprotein ApbE